MKLLLVRLLFPTALLSHWMTCCVDSFVIPAVVVQRHMATTTHLYSEQQQNEPPPLADAPRISNIQKPPVEPGSHEELMYTLGVNLARQLGDIRPLVEDGDELAQVAKGLLDTVIGRLTEDGQKALLASRGKDLSNLISERADNIRKRLEEEGRLMLRQMEETEGVQKLDNGVYVHVLEPNEDGQRPTRSSTVRVHYHGSLPDGTVFDSTADSEPVTFPLAQVIPGWRDGLLKMREGETAMVGIPPEQAYGEEGTPDGRIPGGSTLFFKIQLLEVLSGGVGGTPSLLGADGKKLDKSKAAPRGSGSGLIGADGKPL